MNGENPFIMNRDRFGGFEYPGDDFPFYNGVPAGISGPQWGFVMVMVAIGFAVLGLALTILVGWVVLKLFGARMNDSRKTAILVAWLLSALLFALGHLPAYNWNLMQCLLAIGTARLILTLAYIKTKNVWVSTGSHIINDRAIFAVVLLAR
jgi:membrane protease YdiL (CAAX protease family)